MGIYSCFTSTISAISDLALVCKIHVNSFSLPSTHFVSLYWNRALHTYGFLYYTLLYSIHSSAAAFQTMFLANQHNLYNRFALRLLHIILPSKDPSKLISKSPANAVPLLPSICHHFIFTGLELHTLPHAIISQKQRTYNLYLDRNKYLIQYVMCAGKLEDGSIMDISYVYSRATSSNNTT